MKMNILSIVRFHQQLILKQVVCTLLALSLMMFAHWVHAAANMEIDTPAISAIKANMQARHTQLLPLYNSGAIGLTANGLVEVHDATLVPLKDRGGINALVSAENADRNGLYKEIAKANGHPEWEGEVRQTFAGRWIDKAQAGWWYQGKDGWAKK
jgi:uncharacterized protein